MKIANFKFEMSKVLPRRVIPAFRRRNALALVFVITFLRLVFDTAAVRGADIVGNVEDSGEVELSPLITFVPKSTPYAYGTNTIMDVTRQARPDTNGNFRVHLLGGNYVTDFGPFSKSIRILVPPNDTNVYQFNDVAAAATNLGTFSFTNQWGLISSRVVGPGVTGTNNAGQANEQVVVTGGGTSGALTNGETRSFGVAGTPSFTNSFMVLSNAQSQLTAIVSAMPPGSVFPWMSNDVYYLIIKDRAGALTTNATASGNFITALTGDVTASGPGSAAATIANNAVTYAKMQDVSATQRVLGRNTAGSGDPEEVTGSQELDWIGNTRGSVLYRGASGWAALTPGTSGNVLTSGGAGADPSYQAVSGGFTNMMTSTITFGSSITPSFTIGGLTTQSLRRVQFRLTLTGNITTVNAPTGTLVDGDTMVIEFIQDATGNRTVAGWDSAYQFGGDITGITLTTNASKRDFATFNYNSTSGKWYPLGFTRGY